MLTNGIKTGEYDAAVLSINADNDEARKFFEKAQLRLLEFKSLIGERKRNQLNVSSSRYVGAEVVDVAAVEQEGGEAGVMDLPRAMLTPPIAPNMSPQLAARP